QFLAVTNTDVWVAQQQFSTLANLDITTAQPGPDVDAQIGIRDLVSDQATVWAATCGTPGTVARVDQTEATTIGAGGGLCEYTGETGTPVSIAAGVEGVWVTDGVNGTVSRIQSTNQVEIPIDVGKTPTAVAVGLGSVWVTVDGGQPASPSSGSSP